MSFGTTPPRKDYIGTGVLADYDFDWRIWDPALDLIVTVRDTNGNETTLVYPTDFTVPVTDVNNFEGGTITLVAGNLASGNVLTIRFGGEPQQDTDLRNQGGVFLESIEDAMDRVARYVQGLDDEVARSLHARETESGLDMTLPYDRASRYLAFNANKEPIAVDAASASGTSITPTGALTSRLLADWSADWVNMKFYAVGDGVTLGQTGVATAIAQAFAAGLPVFWPQGTWLTNATIPNFHDVQHRGPGAVKRGASLFYVDPSFHVGTTNNLFIAPTGSNTNDGLSVSEPRLTILSMGSVIYNYPYADSLWTVNLAAGTYNTTGNFFALPFPSANRVQFFGPSVAIGTQPTAIVQGTGGVTETGIYFQGGISAYVKDINFNRFRTGATPAANLLASGIVIDAAGDLYCVNVWCDDCDQGIYVTNGSQIRVQGGRLGFNAVNGNGVQLIRHSHGSIGYNGSAADITGATGTAFIGGGYGVMLQEFSMAHTDNCYFSAQTLAGVILTGASRVHSVTSIYNGCTIGIDGRGLTNLGETSNTFTACPSDRYVRSGSIRLAQGTFPVDDTTDYSAPFRDSLSPFVQATTQSAALVTAYTKTFQVKECQNRGTGFDLVLAHGIAGVANTKTVEVSLGGVVLLTATIGAAVANTRIELEMRVVTATNSLNVTSRIFQDGIAPVVAYTNVTTVDMTSATRDLVVKHKVTNVADTSKLFQTELYLHR